MQALSVSVPGDEPTLQAQQQETIDARTQEQGKLGEARQPQDHNQDAAIRATEDKTDTFDL